MKRLLAILFAFALVLTGAQLAGATHARTADPKRAAHIHHWGPIKASDEFNYTGKPDRNKWSVYNSKGHAGKGLRSPDQWSVANGVATVRGDANGKTGGMSAKFARQKYGKWEARMRVQAGHDPQYHPVLILWPDNKADAYAPGRCWEIDYAEGNNGPGRMSFFNHFACSGNKQTYAKKVLDTSQWHNYAVDWSPRGVVGYIDGQVWFVDRNPSHISNVSMHQTVQLDWFPNGGATRPSWMQVDWVRVYG